MYQISASGYLHLASAASKWDCHLPVHAKAQESIQEALRALPPAKHTELLLLKDELDNISREAAAADAAVAAVAKVCFFCRQMLSLKLSLPFVLALKSSVSLHVWGPVGDSTCSDADSGSEASCCHPGQDIRQ